MKVLSVVGARPQFIKAFAVSRELRKNHDEILVHTGQHYDEELSDIFFERLDMPIPDHNLGVGSGTHGLQTAEMIIGLEELIMEEKPDAVVLYGDTNSTLAGAIAGSKMEPLVIHVEAGLRSDNRAMPEEINRILTDHASDVLCAPSQRAVENLQQEGLESRAYNTGDVMYDALLAVSDALDDTSQFLGDSEYSAGEYVLSTIHRESNTDDRGRLESIFRALAESPKPVILPLHPRTKERLNEYGLWEFATDTIDIVDPVDYETFVQLISNADRIVTDSGSIQKEAFFLDTYCITVRDETEWIETVEAGWNTVVGAEYDAILNALSEDWERPTKKPTPYGGGNASRRIRTILESIVEK